MSLFKRARTYVVLIAVMGGSLMLGTASAHADGNGAQTGSGQSCYDYGSVTACDTYHYEYNAVETKSGVFNYEENYTVTYTVTDNTTGNVVYSDTAKYHDKYQAKQGEIHVVSFRDAYTYTSNGVTYCFSSQFHYANGQDQFDRFSTDC